MSEEISQRKRKDNGRRGILIFEKIAKNENLLSISNGYESRSSTTTLKLETIKSGMPDGRRGEVYLAGYVEGGIYLGRASEIIIKKVRQ